MPAGDHRRDAGGCKERFPAGHWAYLRTANPIDSTFATVRHEPRARNCLTGATFLGFVFRLIEKAEKPGAASAAPTRPRW